MPFIYRELKKLRFQEKKKKTKPELLSLRPEYRVLKNKKQKAG